MEKHATYYHKRLISGAFLLLYAATANAQNIDTDSVSTKEKDLNQAQVVAKRKPVSKFTGPENGFVLSRTELFKAACCNLGESFTTNPSVDVSYSDAATGAKQIKLLGLAGSYVQMLTENIPDFRGAASPYGLGYVPGPWMQSIQVSKGSASVKNGYESITGQINVEYKKPQATPSLEVNLYGDSKSRIEANFDGNVHFNKKPQLSTGILAHYEDNFAHHDENHDGFLDKPKVRQVNAMNRWAWVGDNYIFQAAVSGLSEKREGGQTQHAVTHHGAKRYDIDMQTTRFTAFAKNAFILNKEKGTNFALILSGNYHDADATYGDRLYNVTQKTGYASLMFETNFTQHHSISTGLSLNHDYYNQAYRLVHAVDETPTRNKERETTPGIYAQYTYNLNDKLVAMAGLRADHSSVYGTFVTPRFHVKYAPNNSFNIRLSAGEGYRTVHALAEHNYLLASNRQLVINPLKQERAWNYGASMQYKMPLGGHILDFNLEYYFTNFNEQVVVDYDADNAHIYVHNLNGHRSYSHTLQAEATYTLFRGMTLTAAYRYNFVRQYTGGRVQEKPFTNRYKGLLTASYKTPLELWQFDVTAQLNGGGRRLTNGEDVSSRFPAYAQLNVQITRWFRHFSIYVGGENLTNYKQKTPILNAQNPWSEKFDATQVWGPVHGAMAYAGIRIQY